MTYAQEGSSAAEKTAHHRRLAVEIIELLPDDRGEAFGVLQLAEAMLRLIPQLAAASEGVADP
jgi:hypothetical protein